MRQTLTKHKKKDTFVLRPLIEMHWQMSQTQKIITDERTMSFNHPSLLSCRNWSIQKEWNHINSYTPVQQERERERDKKSRNVKESSMQYSLKMYNTYFTYW